jgi:hypothetical protein
MRRAIQIGSLGAWAACVVAAIVCGSRGAKDVELVWMLLSLVWGFVAVKASP